MSPTAISSQGGGIAPVALVICVFTDSTDIDSKFAAIADITEGAADGAWNCSFQCPELPRNQYNMPIALWNLLSESQTLIVESHFWKQKIVTYRRRITRSMTASSWPASTHIVLIHPLLGQMMLRHGMGRRSWMRNARWRPSCVGRRRRHVLVTEVLSGNKDW